MEAFDERTIQEFEKQFLEDARRHALDPNKRSHLRMILEDDYEVPRKDIFNIEKPKQEYKREQSKKFNSRMRFFLKDNQTWRIAENDLDERIVACT